MASVGLALALVAAVALAGQWLRVSHVAAFGRVGWVGIGILSGCSLILGLPLSGPPAVSTLAWTGYLLVADAAVFAARGRSLLRSSPEAFVWLAILSVFLWLPFEYYNLRLAGWYRSGLPPHLGAYLLLGWSFACIWPALFESADLLHALLSGPGRLGLPRQSPGLPLACGMSLTGAVLLLAPLALPRLDLGEYLLPLASVGFLFLLEPWNVRGGCRGPWWQALSRDHSLLAALAGAGLVCGLWLDALNHLSYPRWHSLWTFSSAGKLLELPWMGYALLPLFAWQALAMYEFAVDALNLPRCRLGASCADAGEVQAQNCGHVVGMR